jgi:dTDP-4-amino-4,6-dideoxygalactose transaminase
MSRVYLSPPDVGQQERDFVNAAIDSNWVAPTGPDLDAFEGDLARWSDRAHAVGVSSGTAGIHLCLHALGIGNGDRVAVSSFTFAASANAIVYTGATPVFIDSDAESWNIDAEALASACEAGIREQRPIRALVAVDLYGQCCDFEALREVCARYDLVVIEDAAEALGATNAGRRAGSFGLAAVFSFNGNKIITTSGGGMIVTDDAAFAQRLRYLATQAREPVAHYEHTEIGFNYRLSNILAAFGRGQIAALPDKIERRAAVKARYRAGFSDLPVTFMPTPSWSEPNHWLTCITLDAGAPVDREAIRLALEAEDIESRALWKPMHQQPVFKAADAVLTGVSDDLFLRGLCLPSGSALSEVDQQRVIDIVRRQFV